MDVFESVVAEIALRAASDGDVVRGRAEAQAAACVPGTDLLRTSMVAMWADVVTGIIAARATLPRVPFTLDLEVQVERPPTAGSAVVIEGSALKIGRTVVVTEARFRDEDDGAPLAVAIASFMASPDPANVLPEGLLPGMEGFNRRLPLPFAERVGCTVPEPGVAVAPHRRINLNSSGAIQGGVVALLAEEAASSRVNRPAVVDSLSIRYLRPLMNGDARAVATHGSGHAVVHITDTATGKLGAVATARWDAPQ